MGKIPISVGIREDSRSGFRGLGLGFVGIGFDRLAAGLERGPGADEREKEVARGFEEPDMRPGC